MELDELLDCLVAVLEDFIIVEGFTVLDDALHLHLVLLDSSEIDFGALLEWDGVRRAHHGRRYFATQKLLDAPVAEKVFPVESVLVPDTRQAVDYLLQGRWNFTKSLITDIVVEILDQKAGFFETYREGVIGEHAKLIERHAEREDVRLRAVLLGAALTRELRSLEAVGSLVRDNHLVADDRARKPEIRELEVSVRDEDIGWLDIAVNQVVLLELEVPSAYLHNQVIDSIAARGTELLLTLSGILERGPK